MMWRILFVLLVTATPAFAMSPDRLPVRHDVFSRNRKFVLDVDPDTKIHVIYDRHDQKKPLWSFSCKVGSFLFLLSDDGQVVAAVAEEHVQKERIPHTDAVTFWNKDGKFRSYPLQDLCPDPPMNPYKGDGPMDSSSRTWYVGVKGDGDSFTIKTTTWVGYRWVEYRFRYSDGELGEPSGTWTALAACFLPVGLLLVCWLGGVTLWKWKVTRRTPPTTAP
jgi:hypothetical protein